MKNYKKYLFVITLAYFAIGLINIHMAAFGLICMMLPLILLFKNKKKTWCQSYCPRAALYTNCGKLTTKYSRKTPKFFIKGKMKWIMLGYFGINLLIIIVSTIKVASGSLMPMTYLRFLLIFKLPSPMPQLIEFPNMAPWLTHFSFRFYSMMMTTTMLGLIMALVYKPRTWCTICPIATVSDLYINKK